MRIEIERINGLNCERWIFTARIDSGSSCIYFDDYSQEHKDNFRQRIWRIDKRWTRLDCRNNTIQNPEIPLGVTMELYKRLKEFIDTLQIVR